MPVNVLCMSSSGLAAVFSSFCRAALTLLVMQHLLQGEDVFPIPGTKRVKYLEENVAAFHIKLSKQELDELEAVFHGKVSGARYNADGMKKAFYGGE